MSYPYISLHYTQKYIIFSLLYHKVSNYHDQKGENLQYSIVSYRKVLLYNLIKMGKLKLGYLQLKEKTL